MYYEQTSVECKWILDGNSIYNLGANLFVKSRCHDDGAQALNKMYNTTVDDDADHPSSFVWHRVAYITKKINILLNILYEQVHIFIVGILSSTR